MVLCDSFIYVLLFPLNGCLFANIFIHFKPVNEEEILELPPTSLKTHQKQKPGVEHHQAGLLLETVSEAWKAHGYAATNDLKKLKILEEKNSNLLHKEAINVWQPLHEAVRAGHVGIVECLLKHDVSIDHWTNQGDEEVHLWVFPYNLFLQIILSWNC
jgi:hypothetical protein